MMKRQTAIFNGLKSLKDIWNNTPPTWESSYPCGNKWDGIECSNSHVTSIKLSSMGLVGLLSGEIHLLSKLQTLDLSYIKGLVGLLPPSIGKLNKLSNLILVGCSFSGPIPDEIGSLKELVFLSLNSNQFSGRIPPSIGNLDKLYWLDLADNNLEGPIPVSSGSTPGLDLLVHTKHFHLGQNKLLGPIPEKLSSANMSLIHFLFESNGLVQTLEVLRLDGNKLSGDVPTNLNNLTQVAEMHLSNNKLTGLLLNLTGMKNLTYVDMSNNSFDASDFPSWFSTLESLTTIVMERTQLRGEIQVSLFSLPSLQSVILRNNDLNGMLDMGTSYSNQLRLVDLQQNYITKFEGSNEVNNVVIMNNTELLQNPASESNVSYVTPKYRCNPIPCSSNKISSPNCKCAYPYTGTLFLTAPSFSRLTSFFKQHSHPVDAVSVSDPFRNPTQFSVMRLEVFPDGSDHFNRLEVLNMGFTLSNQTFKPPILFGPYYFYCIQVTTESKKSSKSSIGIIVGAAAGGTFLVLLLLLASMYAFRQKRRVERANEKLKKYTNNFSEANNIGSGGYGKVYRGTLPTGELIAIKRAQRESMQGGLEFKTEIELLSRVRHKNLVSLLGFCFEKGEQMLIYEHVTNGSLKDSLSGKSGIKLDWTRRLRIALGAARGLTYLHELANPPIIHRDIKSTNVLLDDGLNAKVADFGLSKLMVDGEKDHVTTQVKGTLGYLDPEYFMTQQLTEKSDVYSFGVLLLELIMARRPIERGKYIVRELRMAMDKSKDLYNLQEVLDATIETLIFSGLTRLIGFERFVELAMKCVEDARTDRPTMSEVVKEI
ncbi:hypothetical protein UlMin_037695 [Ulmus minor]